jgi:hypothetical protein
VRIVLRWVVGLAAVGLIPLALPGAGLIWFVGSFSLQRPRPCAPGEEALCWQPQTWDEVHEGIGWMFGIAALDGVVCGAAVAGLWWAVTGRAPRWRRLALIPACAIVIVAVVTEPWWT